jgi:lysophospholipase L1-like esterase
LHSGKTPEQVFADFKDFVARVQARLPATEIVFIGLCPSVARWPEAARERALNRLVANFAEGQPHVKFLDAANVSLDADGRPRPELFVSDQLHFNAEGYKLLAARVRPWLKP